MAINRKMEATIFTIISCAGQARSLCFSALQAARQGDFTAAEEALARAQAELLKTHQVHTDMIQREAAGEPQAVSLLLMHAEDHLMTSLFAKDLMVELVAMLKEQAERRNGVNSIGA